MQIFVGKNRGAISVFLTLILVPVLVFSGIIVDASRLFAAKTVISGAGELTMNAALAQYDKELKDKYGLIAMAKKPDSEESSAKLKQYFRESVNASELEDAGEEGMHSMIQLELCDDSFSAKGVENTSLANMDVLRQQILEYMKFRAPVYMVDEIIAKFRNLPVNDIDQKKDYIEKKTKYGKEAAKLGDPLEEAKKYVDLQNASLAAASAEAANVNAELSAFKENSVFWLAARSLKKYITYTRSGPENYAPSLGSRLTVDQVKGYLSHDLRWSAGKTEFSQSFYDNLVRAAALYQNKSTLGSDITEENGFTKSEINQFWDIKSDIQYSISNLDKIYNDYKSDYKRNIDAYEGTADQVISSGKKAVKSLEKVKSIWENKVEGAWNDYREASDSLKATGEDMDFENSNEDFVIDTAEIDDMIMYIEANIKTAEEYKKKLENFKKVPENLTKDGITAAEGDLLYAKEEDIAVDAIWNSRWSDMDIPEMSSLSYYNLEECAFYKNCLANIQELSEEEKKERKKKEKENASNGEEGQESFSKILEWIKQLENEKDLKSYEGMSYPDDFPSKLAEAVDTSNQVEKIDFDSEDNLSSAISDSALSNISKIQTLLNGLDSLAGEVLERAYLMEYMTEMFNCLTTEAEASEKKDDSVKQSLSGDDLTAHYIKNGEMEYILYGNSKTAVNKTYAVSQIFALRLLINSIYVFTDKEENAVADGVAAALSMGQAWLYPIIKYGYLFCRAIYRSGEDVSKLVEGKSVPFWPGEKNGGKILEFSYKEYLKLFMLISLISDENEKNLVMRTADCIQLNTGKKLSDKYTMLTLKAEVKAAVSFLPKVPAFLGKENEEGDGKKKITYRSVLAY